MQNRGIGIGSSPTVSVMKLLHAFAHPSVRPRRSKTRMNHRYRDVAIVQNIQNGNRFSR